MAREVGLAPGEVLLDFPARSSMLGVDLPAPHAWRRRRAPDGRGASRPLGLPRVADELYRSARRLRVFVKDAPTVPLHGVPELLTCTADEVRRRLDEGSPLLQRRNVR